MVQFLSIIFFSWISSIFVGFFKSSRFFVSPCITRFRAIEIKIRMEDILMTFYYAPLLQNNFPPQLLPVIYTPSSQNKNTLLIFLCN